MASLGPLLKLHLGATALLRVERDNMTISVEVIDIRSSYGRIDYRVTPEHGSGSAWVQAVRLEGLPNA